MPTSNSNQQKFGYNVNVYAANEAEAKQKLRAFVSMSKELDGKTFTAVATKLPAILNDPQIADAIKNFLGLS